MEKSIETIWKEGFLKADALIAPKLNDLYNKKSMHIIDKFERMFRINLNAIVIGSLIFLGLSILLGFPIMGVGFFITLTIIVFVNRKLLRSLREIDKSSNSYDYLKKFDHWMKSQLRINRRMAGFYYPIFFALFVLGFWFGDINGKNPGELIARKMLGAFPDLILIHGVPLVLVVFVLLIIAVLTIFGGRIYSWDVGIVYGNIFTKLEELISEMEDLRDQS